MKKLLLIGVLVCAILASVVTGTLAVYQVTVEESSGDIVAKAFKFVGEGNDSFDDGFTLAPYEKVEMIFTAQNFTGSGNSMIVSETDMTIKADFDLVGSAFDLIGKPGWIEIPDTQEMIDLGLIPGSKVSANLVPYFPMTVTAKVDGVAVDDYKSVLLKANTASTVVYTIVLEWTAYWNLVDTPLEGQHLGNLEVKLVATQA